jgi:signal transduction histidine kinase
LSNAFKYVDPAKSQAAVIIKAALKDSLLYLEIEDNGIGISNEHKDKIFDLFYRGTARSNGAGLGLAIVKEMANKMDASIEIESEVAKGSVFRLKVPIDTM